MVVDMRARRGGAVAKAPPPALNSVRPKLFRRASLTSWGKNNLGMTRAAAINFKELLLTVQQQKYEDRDKAAQREISRNVSWEDDQSIRHRDERRSRLLLRSAAKRNFLEKWEREGQAKWNANQAALCRYERRLLNYELAVKATARARQRISRARHTHDQVDGIRWFEKNLDRLGLDPGGGSSGGGGAGGAAGGTLLPDKETPATFRSRLVRAVLDQNFVPGSNAEVMAELRFRGITGRRGRQEREHRRVKTEVDQRRAKAETDAQCSADQHLRRMLDEGRERRELAAAHWAEKHELERRLNSDKERFAEIAAAREDAFEAAFNERARRARDSYEAGGAEREAESDARRARQKRHREEKRGRVELMCSQVVQKMVDLAMVASEVRASQGGNPLPPTTSSHLKRWFCSSEPFFVDAAPPEPPSEPSDPALDAKTILESRNLDRFEGTWRPRGGLPPELTGEPSPLSRALDVARELIEASGSGPREAPTYGRCGRVAGGGDRKISVRLVLLGQREGFGDLCAELGRWTQLYVCSLDTALECAMELSAEAASSDGKGGKGQRGRKNSVGGDTVETLEGDDNLLALQKAKETTFQKCFHPDAHEEDVEAFKAAALAYHALRTHPKKASAPVPLATTTDLLVKHLSCRAPRGVGRGWAIVGYPNSLLESKLLENALSGYTDDEVAAELGTGGKTSKTDAKTKKGSVPPQQEEEAKVTPRSGLDAVLNLPRSRSAGTTRREKRPAESSAGTEGGGEEEGEPNDEIVAPQATEGAGGTGQGIGESRSEEGDSFEERDVKASWWQGFEGGNVWCDVPDEANDERLLETLFLLVNAAQNRKDDHQAWLEEKPAPKRLEDEAAQSLEGDSTMADPDGGEDGATIRTTSARAVHLASPLEVPLTATLEDLRRERRASMPHSTRIQIEALTGDRELDMQGVRTVVSEAGAKAAIPVDEAAASTTSSSLTAAMRKLEAECPAVSVVGWATLALFSFCRELRAPDDRWTTACLRFERQISAWLTRRSEALAAEAANSRSRNVRAKRPGSGNRSVTALAIPPAEEDLIWEALEAFQLETGDVVDDRHCSAEAIMREIDAESDRKVHTWIGDVESAAADLCAAERVSYRKTVKTLRTLDSLFGLEEDCTDNNAERVRKATYAAVDALTEGLPAMAEGRGAVIDGGFLEKEVRRAVQEVFLLPRNGKTSASHESRHELAPSSVGSEVEKDNLPPQGYRDIEIEDGSGSMERGNGRAGAHRESTSSVTAPRAQASSGGGEGDKESVALNTAIWRCRLIYISRLRGVVTRLVRVVGQCEAKMSSMRAALRRLKRRRVQLEHDGFSVATSTVRRALEVCDNTTITDILEKGIPVWIKDDETFAADPNVALPWGMSGLGLPHITDLTRTLRRSFARAEDEAMGTMLRGPELSQALRAWSNSEGTKFDGGKEDLPRAWTSSNKGYIDKLCEAMTSGENTGEVPWRRLVHALLLGHVRYLPTLEDLRLMHNAFSKKVSTASRASIGEALKKSTTAENTAQATTSSAIQAPTLRIAQRHLPGVPWWFEQLDIEAGRGTEHVGSDSWSSTIRAVYAEAWGGDDGRVDGMDLLLTLCAVPDDRVAEAVALEEYQGDDEENGVPFSPGLFRAFFMLAETSYSANGIPAVNSRVLSDPDSTTGAAPSSSTGPEERETASNPRVSLPHLKAILEHGGGMPLSAADVVDVCHLVREKVEVGRVLEQRPEEARAASPADAASTRDGPDTELKPHETEGTSREGMEATATLSDRLQAERSDGDVATGESQEDRYNASRETPAERTAGEDGIAAERTGRPALTVSFAAVSECEAVRAWVRKGAYTLPAFNVTSGRQEG